MNPASAPSLFQTSLNEQVAYLLQSIRHAPTDSRLRIHYAQLCMVKGDWERAAAQLQTIAQIDAKCRLMSHTYQDAIRCERTREQVFAGQLEAKPLGQPRGWLASLARSLACRAQGDSTQALELHTRAFEEAGETPFLIDGTQVEWIADGDSRLGPVCELFLDGQYCWLPFENIQRLEIDAPSDLSDLVWIPARVTLNSGDPHSVLLPARYPFSHSEQDALALGTLTEWRPLSDTLWTGTGQRMLISPAGEHPLLEIRQLLSLATQP